ncbi:MULTISPECIES: efflux RND transporter periplasmic adaptor subunit [Bradyrhizobium]|nr:MULTISPECIES: efflux RND transporter periplasmic adaptor subunit [Bradyrhizobium]WLB49740.1 efflux RND transporter periplasmic adaptor subunit [Bradyrhizobium ottawaense]WQN79773.1 efflux RND transporter periplasmic adaptor subunit [Bradyrhizobium ottawaense]BBO06075.1 MexX family efflux pump subunit [Bradyrhizobium ottawaense]BBO12780.1 MexX family efflux pump subunit [Bradyrhizobium sp. TM102]GMO18481.1 efflux RND transporter periplasmic adaptor subunit [Bradyrhizobium ottawaense]
MRSPIVRAVPLIALLLAACGEQNPQAALQQMVPEVGIMTLKPQEAKISTVLPGRVVAYQVSEVRPQVTGILLKRDFVEGAEVREGDLLYEIDPVQYKAGLASAEAAVQRSEATLVSVKLKAARKTQLLQTNAASQQDVDDAVAAYKQGEADVKAAEANRDTAAISLDRTKVTASISGRIGKSSITPGALVTASQATAMTTIQQLDPVYVDLDQSTSEMERLRNQIASGRLKRPAEGVQVELLMESGRAYGHKGKYGFTDASVNESTGSVSSRAVFANPERALLPGMYVRARVVAGVDTAAILVPQRAVSRNPLGQAVAMFVDKDGKVEQRTLELGEDVGSNWLVRSGAKAGDRLVVEGTQKARPGAPVKTVEVAVDPATGLAVNPTRQADARPAAATAEQ